MIVIATYPRSMSAWLANFLTIPNHSMYIHDGLYFTRMQQYLRANYSHRGVVAPAAKESMLPDCRLIVIDNNLVDVQNSVKNWLGDSSTVGITYDRIEELKPLAEKVYNLKDMDFWIAELFETCTGLEFDPDYYNALKEFHIEGMIARTKGAELKRLTDEMSDLSS